ncbi:hypothetical protein Ae201684_019107 [Aphanomyces euteiches]|uniref:Uncharacterized protein n=1 Tax=Aphanomyces euteiches TaxID=100861 RepID=A0A6G0W3F8_9STRA|nr:hypothetical protein Ae201684_019107 [Aphanomyces euteiches]
MATVSGYFGTLTLRSDHPASPDQLTRYGPLATWIFTSTGSIKKPTGLTHLKFENRSRNCCYPEGNFGGNQLLDGSISLSPLYLNLTIDLHVRIATSFHQSIVHHLSGTNIYAHTQIFHPEVHDRSIVPEPLQLLPTKDTKSALYFHYALGFPHPNTCTHVRLLGPCFKTGRIAPFRQSPEQQRLISLSRIINHQHSKLSKQRITRQNNTSQSML